MSPRSLRRNFLNLALASGIFGALLKWQGEGLPESAGAILPWAGTALVSALILFAASGLGPLIWYAVRHFQPARAGGPFVLWWLAWLALAGLVVFAAPELTAWRP